MADQPPAATIHDLETHTRRGRTRRSLTSLTTSSQRLLMSAMKFYPSSSSDNPPGEGNTPNIPTSWQRTPLVVMRLETKRRRHLAKGWDADTASIIIDSPELKRKQRDYLSIQDRYIKWTTAREMDAMEPQPVQLLNWITSGFFLALRRREIKHTKESNIDITPAIDYFRQQGQNEGLNRITSILPILIPKKTRGGNRICEYTTIKSHDDPFLCPVKTLTEYLRRIQGHDIDVLHPKDPLILYRPLLRDAKDPGRYIGAECISDQSPPSVESSPCQRTLSYLRLAPLDPRPPSSKAHVLTALLCMAINPLPSYSQFLSIECRYRDQLHIDDYTQKQ
ncbi:hypothetical protein BGZ54_001675 [Gamsiella multidivaricata]|nr:hypothetical protein BGZ54_001675 [Gamsiella multidivaricata]